MAGALYGSAKVPKVEKSSEEENDPFFFLVPPPPKDTGGSSGRDNDEAMESKPSASETRTDTQAKTQKNTNPIPGITVV